MTLKSTSEKRNVYKDKDGNKMRGVTVTEMIDKPVTILAKRNYTWGKFDGLAVKIMGENGNLGIVEITANFLIKALCSPKFPKLPVAGHFRSKLSEKNKHPYFVFEIATEGDDGKEEPPTEDLWF